MIGTEGNVSIQQISSREVYRNPWCRVREDVIERSVPGSTEGVRGIYGVMDKDPACIVIPLERAADGEYLWLVRQFRYTVGATYYELPQGGWETEDVDTEELARGELAEETGLRAERMTPLADLWIAYGAMRQIHHVFLAEGLTQGETERDPEEHDMTVHRVPVKEFEAMILDGRVMDNCTVSAWGVYRVWKDKQAVGNGV
jgi:8-oxo-dGTP pyrophosphatase MutT (NUDIX family)